MKTMAFIVVLIGIVAVTANAAGDQWPQFRGPQAGVATDDPDLPEVWSEAENVAWRREVPGRGWSSPIVWDDHVFVVSVTTDGQDEVPKPGIYASHMQVRSDALHHWTLYDIELETGRIRWKREVRIGVPDGSTHLKNGYASETPVTDGERVYVYFGGFGLFALDFSGTLLWSKDLGALNNAMGWGTAASPVLHKGRIYIVNDNAKASFIAAYDARTGAEAWRVTREETGSWATPYVWEHELRTEIVTAGATKIRSYGLDGTLLWELKGMSSLAIPTPFSRHGLVYITSGYPGDARRPVYAIKPGASGDISLKEGEQSNQFVAWSHPQLGPYNTSPIVYGDSYYTLLDRGFLMNHEAKTGRQIYGRQRIAPEASGFSSSPWAYNGKIFAMSEDGDTFVIQAGPDFKVLRKNSLGEMTMATPAIAGKSLLIRTASHLYRIAKQ